MPTPVPAQEPARHAAGDTLAFELILSEFPASQGWALSYELVNSAGRISFSSSPAADAHAITVPAATTSGWAPGHYAWYARCSKGGEAYIVRTGQIDILPNPAGAAWDTRTHARRTLDAIESWIEGHDLAVAGYTIGDRRMEHIPLGDLLTLRSHYRAEVRAQAAAAQGRLPNKIQVRL